MPKLVLLAHKIPLIGVMRQVDKITCVKGVADIKPFVVVDYPLILLLDNIKSPFKAKCY